MKSRNCSKPVRIASYNVRNLFLRNAALPVDPFLQIRSPVQMRDLARSVDKLAADVLMLQEVGSAEALQYLNECLTQSYEHRGLLPGNSDRGIHLAVLSRYPVQLTSHRERLLLDEKSTPLSEYASEADALQGRLTPLKLQRDLLLCEVRLPQTVLAVFNVHLKSKTQKSWRRQSSDDVRAAEARLVAAALSEYRLRFPHTPRLLAGDFNDSLHSNALNALRALELFDPHGEWLAQTGRNPSTYWSKRRTRIDYLLLCRSLRANLLESSVTIHSSQLARRASDHYPVSIDLDFNSVPTR